MIATLLKKGWRVFRAPIIGSLVTTGILYATAAIIAFAENDLSSDALYHTAVQTASLGLIVTAVLAAAFGGMAFAAERRDRSADFLAMLPIARGRIILSKVLVVFACLLCLWLFNVGILAVWLLIRIQYLPFATSEIPDLAWNASFSVATAVMLFGMAWLLSTFLSSPALSASISCAVPVLGFFVWELASRGYDEHIFFRVWIVCSLLLGIVCFLVGTIYYCRRVEP